MTTNGATLRGIARINPLDANASPLRLVGHRRPHWVERPGVPLSALTTSNPGPLANTAQVLQSDTAPGALPGFHKGLADAVVDVGWRARLSACQLSESTLGTLGAYRWQCDAALSEPLVLVLPELAALYVPVAGGSDCATTQMDAQPALRVVGIGRFHLADLVPIERTCPVDQFCLALQRLEPLKLALTGQQQAACVIGHRPQGLEDAPALTVQPLSAAHLGNDAHRDLSCLVKAFVQVVVSEGLGVPGAVADVVSRSAGGFKRALERIRLLGRGLDLDLCDYLHDGPVLKDEPARMFGVSKALAFLAVAPEGCGADVPGWANVGACSPKWGSSEPYA